MQVVAVEGLLPLLVLAELVVVVMGEIHLLLMGLLELILLELAVAVVARLVQFQAMVLVVLVDPVL
jgi:hypothetical protein